MGAFPPENKEARDTANREPGAYPWAAVAKHYSQAVRLGSQIHPSQVTKKALSGKLPDLG